MFSLVVGGSASGKSEYAERLVLGLPDAGERIYVATMEPWDEECQARIEKHRARRASYGFRTVERYTDLAGLDVPEGSNALLECVSNLLANEMYAPEGAAAAKDAAGAACAGSAAGSADSAGRTVSVEAVLSGIRALRARCGDLTVVTNEIFSGGAEYGEETLEYMKALAEINAALASEADFVCEIVCGRPNVLKGCVR